MRLRGFVEADTSLFNVFTFEFVKGDRHALDRPGTIILTSSLARSIFGDEDPMSKLLSFVDRSNKTFEVSGIIEDVPSNSHLEIKALLPFGALGDDQDVPMDGWSVGVDGSSSLYLRIKVPTFVIRLSLLPIVS